MGIIWENSLVVFILMTCVLGGGAAWMSGRAVALTWKPFWHVFIYVGLLALAVRFLHFSLFNGTLLTLHYLIVDAVVLLVLAALGFRVTQTTQMVTQYRWLYQRTSPFTWTEKKEEARVSVPEKEA